MQVNNKLRAPSQVTVLRRLAPTPKPQAKEAIRSATQVLGQDTLKVSHTQPKAVPATSRLAKAAPQERTWQDYQHMMSWVEQATGKPIAYQDPKSQHAYIKSIQGKSQSHYDTKGFLSSIGVENTLTYGRDEKGVHQLLQTVDYSPDSSEVSWVLRKTQKFMFGFFMKAPKLFSKVGNLVDKHYFTRKDRKQKSWQNMQVPQPGIHPHEPLINPIKIKERYKDTQASQSLSQTGHAPNTKATFEALFVKPGEMGAQFEGDFHMGVPKDGETEQNYGTYAIAKRLGFSEESAARIGTANFDTDLNVTDYGNTDAFPDGLPSRHFNLNKKHPEKGDTRFIWAQRHLEAAVDLAKLGRFEQAEKELGYGLHGVQDAFAHGHISLVSHAITDNIPDGVDYNPVGAYEATQATVGYLNKYIEMVMAP